MIKMRIIYRELMKEVTDPKRAGEIGEAVLFRLVSQHFPKENMFRNTYIKCSDGNITEIDLLAVDKRGIFVFEMKNYSGFIIGSVKDDKLTQITLNNRKLEIFNPIKQNEYHIKCLKDYFGNDTLPFHNITVISNHCNLRLDSMNGLIRIKHVKQTLEGYKDIKLTKEEVNILIRQLHVLNEKKEEYKRLKGDK